MELEEFEMALRSAGVPEDLLSELIETEVSFFRNPQVPIRVKRLFNSVLNAMGLVIYAENPEVAVIFLELLRKTIEVFLLGYNR